MDKVNAAFDRLEKALKRAEMMGNCLTAILGFIQSQNLEAELFSYLREVKDPYFLGFMNRKTKETKTSG